MDWFDDADRIAQLLFNVPVELVQVDELTPTERGKGGFGSTGRRDEDGKREK